MRLSELWLEDLFRIYLRSREPLDRGPFRGRPALYNPRDFGNPSEFDIEWAIRQKLEQRISQEAVDVMGYYVRFVNSSDRGAVDERKRQQLLDLIRTRRRIYVSDKTHVTSGVSALEAALGDFERRLWRVNGPAINLYDRMPDTIAVWEHYYSVLEVFINAIAEIVRYSGTSNMGVRIAPLEVDYFAQRSVLATSGFLSSPHSQNVRASEAALQAWNGLTPHQRSAIAGRIRLAQRELFLEIDRLRRGRGINVLFAPARLPLPVP
jgi:hypothetical protein